MAKRRKTTKDTRMRLYTVAQYLPRSAKIELGLEIPFEVYMQDPSEAEENPAIGFDTEFYVPWEPGITDGPTSARFAIVDYNGNTERLAPMATWDAKQELFLDPEGRVLNAENRASLQFHQVNVWAILQKALAYFEAGQGLGRPIPFGFEGNRLIVVPHAGYGRNAFYDRKSKSLQFYYFNDEEGKRINTCLSMDIVNHEFGHALLDGIRPYFFEGTRVETAAFHEFIGDLTAILLLLRNNTFRRWLAETTEGDMTKAKRLGHIAEEFGKAVSGKPYLRTAFKKDTMSDLKVTDGPHRVSEVMTGAMFDILMAFSQHYLKARNKKAKSAFWNAIDRMQRTAIQPLDLLAPVDVTFRDYALAVLRAEALSNPTDPYHYSAMMQEIFLAREILTPEDLDAFREPGYLYERLRLKIFHDIDDLSRSRAAAYKFLNDNRDQLSIPAHQNVIVADLYDANKLGRQARRLPRQIILSYIWREDVRLEGKRFGAYNGQYTTMLCGATLVFDEQGTLLSWFRKPGTEGGDSEKWREEIAIGQQRRQTLLDDLARRIQTGQVGASLGSSKGLLGTHMPPLTVREQEGQLRFELSPHMNLVGEDHEHYDGGPRWEVSS